MNKNTLTAFVLMALVVFGFMAYENYARREQMAEQVVLDSIAQVEAQKEAKVRQKELEKKAEELADTLNPLFEARKGTASTTVIENELLRVTLSNKGGQLQKVELKDSTYKSREGGNVVLFDGHDQNMKLMLDGKTANIVTDELFFTPTDVSKDGVTMHLPIASGSLDIIYSLKPNAYILDMDVKATGLEGFFPSKTNEMQLEWTEDMKQQEKGYDFENRYSTVTYRDTDGDTHELSVSGGDEEEDEFEEKVKWITYKTQFFSQVLIADAPMTVNTMSSAYLENGSGYLKTYKTTFAADFDTKGVKPTCFHLYLGPNKFSTLKENEKLVNSDDDLDLQSLVYMGWPIIKWINRFIFLYAFDFLTGLGLNMGIVLVLLTLIVKFLVFPLMKKSYTASANMRVLRPKMDEINAKYPKKEDAMLKQQEMMKLYSEYGVSPMGGCLPMLIQMPIWIALFNFIPNAIELRGESFLWASDLSAYDDVIRWGKDIWLVGNHISIFCLLFSLTNIGNTWISMKQQQSNAMMSQEQQAQMKMMQWMMVLMPIAFFFIFNDYSSGLSYYYYLSGLTTILIMWGLRKFTDDKKLRQQLDDYKARHQNDPKKMGGFAARLEAMQKMAEEQQTKNQGLRG